MDSTGNILDIGQPATTISNATVGCAVAKSGRTTGFTTGTISSVNTDVSVQYQKNCGSGKRFIITYSDQVVIKGSSFSLRAGSPRGLDIP